MAGSESFSEVYHKHPISLYRTEVPVTDGHLGYEASERKRKKNEGGEKRKRRGGDEGSGRG